MGQNGDNCVTCRAFGEGLWFEIVLKKTRFAIAQGASHLHASCAVVPVAQGPLRGKGVLKEEFLVVGGLGWSPGRPSDSTPTRTPPWGERSYQSFRQSTSPALARVRSPTRPRAHRRMLASFWGVATMTLALQLNGVSYPGQGTVETPHRCTELAIHFAVR